MRRTRRQTGWRATTPDPKVIGPLLRDAGFVGSEVDPVTVVARFDDAGRPRRIHARYPDGWTCTMHLSADGSSSTLSQSHRMRVARRAVSA